MSDLFLLSEDVIARISPYFLLLHRGARTMTDASSVHWLYQQTRFAENKMLLSAMVRMKRSIIALSARAALKSPIAFFLSCRARQEASILDDWGGTSQDASHCCKTVKKGIFPIVINGCLNLKLPAGCDEKGKLICLLLSESERSDYKGASLLLPEIGDAMKLVTNRGMMPTGSGRPWISGNKDLHFSKEG